MAGTTPFTIGADVSYTDALCGKVRDVVIHLVIDSGSRQVTHVLLQEGYVFSRKAVAIPTGAVTAVNQNGIQLNITKQQVKGLPCSSHRSPG